MPANAAAWYMAKRKYYLKEPLEQQLLSILLKKFPEKFRLSGKKVLVTGSIVYDCFFPLRSFSWKCMKKKRQDRSCSTSSLRASVPTFATKSTSTECTSLTPATTR